MTTVKLVMAAAMSALGLAACGDENGGGLRTVTVPAAETSAQQSSTTAPPDGDAILIETRVTDVQNHIGEVREFLIGESAFCRRGKTSGGSDGPTITSTFQCPDGTLKVRFAPTQRSFVQSAPWEVLSGTGSYKDLHGGGSMVASFPKDDPHAAGREIFTGTVGK